MTIAYLGGPPWNPNVMYEVGYRLNTNLPLVYLCDQDDRGDDLPLPFNIQGQRFVSLPVSGVDAGKIETLIEVIRASEREPRHLEWLHPIALINVRNRDTISKHNMLYTAASESAEELFGIDGRLVGLTMEEFLHAAKKRMPPAQYDAFSANQRQARKDLQGRMTNACGARNCQHPVVLRRPRDRKIQRPGVPADPPPGLHARDQGLVQHEGPLSRRDLGLPEGDKPLGGGVLLLQPRPRHRDAVGPAQDGQAGAVFLSYSRHDRDVVEQLFGRLKECFYPEVNPWMDLDDLYAVSNFPEKLTQAIQDADHALIFFGTGGPGNGQSWEINLMTGRLIKNYNSNPKFRVTPILLEGVEALPEGMSALAVNGIVKMSEIEHYFEKCLRRILFPERYNG